MNPNFNDKIIQKNYSYNNLPYDYILNQCNILNDKLDKIKEELLIKKNKILDERKKRIIVKAIPKIRPKNSIKNPKIRNLSKNQNNKNNIHSKFAFDNISQKIKVLFHKFLINLINDFIFKVYGGFQKFKIRKISSKITQNVTKKYNHFLSNCTLKAFFTNKISTKYRKISENKNFESIQKLIEFKPKLIFFCL